MVRGLAEDHETPGWLDELIDREDMTIEEYAMSFGMTRGEFWELYYALEGLDENPQDFFTNELIRELSVSEEGAE